MPELDGLRQAGEGLASAAHIVKGARPDCFDELIAVLQAAGDKLVARVRHRT
jgi:hypothetical protein